MDGIESSDNDAAVLQLDEAAISDKSSRSLQLSIPVFENDPGSPASFSDFKLPIGYFPVKPMIENTPEASQIEVNSKSVGETSLIPLVGGSFADVTLNSVETSIETGKVNRSNRVVPEVDELQKIFPFTSVADSFSKRKEFQLNPLVEEKPKTSARLLNSGVMRKDLPFKPDDVSSDVHTDGKPISWSNGSFGFGSLDIIPEYKGKKPRKGIESMESEFEITPQSWGWVVMIASWIIMIPIVGIMSSFGTVVSTLTNHFNSTKLEAGWVGSLVFGVTVGLCPLSNVLILVYGKRCVALIGVIGSAVCAFVTSFIPYLPLMILTYSIGLGVFANLVYNSSLTLTGLYFPNKHQALATCIASAGISFGTIVFNPVSRILVVNVGWRNTFRVYGGLILVVGLLCAATFRPPQSTAKVANAEYSMREKKSKRKSLRSKTDGVYLKKIGLIKEDNTLPSEDLRSSSFVEEESKLALARRELICSESAFDCTICREVTFILWLVGTFLWSFTLLFPHIFLIDYMETLGIPLQSGAVVLTVFGIFDLIGRIGCAFVAGKLRFSFAYVYSLCAFISGVTTLLTPFGKELKVLYIYVLFVGINSGIINSLLFAATMQFFSKEKGRHAWGYVNVMLASGMVGGPVFAGGVFDATGSYKIALYVNGLLYVICSAVMVSIPVVGYRSSQDAVATQIANLLDNSRDMVAEASYLSSSIVPEHLSRSSMTKRGKVPAPVERMSLVRDHVIPNSENPPPLV